MRRKKKTSFWKNFKNELKTDSAFRSFIGILGATVVIIFSALVNCLAWGGKPFSHFSAFFVVVSNCLAYLTYGLISFLPVSRKKKISRKPRNSTIGTIVSKTSE